MSSEMPREGLTRLNFITRYPALLLTLGLVGWLEAIFSIEWSSAYCSSQEDGPSSAVFGMPLPYIRWAGVSSMEYEFMPLIWILNIVILSAIAFPLVSLAVKKVAAPNQGRRRSLLSLGGLVLLLSIGAWTALLVGIGARFPVSTIASAYETYTEFRPVRFTFNDLHYDCTPSKYWFKDGWRPKPGKEAGTTK